MEEFKPLFDIKKLITINDKVKELLNYIKKECIYISKEIKGERNEKQY